MTEHITEPRDSQKPKDPPPGAVSDQNGEEAESGHREAGPPPKNTGEGKDEARQPKPPPRATGQDR